MPRLATFTIRPLADLPAGTEILNNASVYFDLNDSIITNMVINTIFSCDMMGVAAEAPTISCGVSEFVYDPQLMYVESYQWMVHGL